MMRRAFINLIGCLAICWPLASYAQQPDQPQKRVEFLIPGPCSPKPDQIITRRLGELGWIVGQTIVIDCVSATGRFDQVPALARELVSRRPDVLSSGPSAFIKELKQETTTIPIVMLGAGDPVG
jgi:putative tryptophan/tyrosine transport system substrate-binding protein